MQRDLTNNGWKQHFPTYDFGERDVALEEYRFATKVLEAEERVFLNAANLSVVVAAALGSLVLGTLERVAEALSPAIPEMVTLAILAALIYGFSMLTLRYFADRHKAVIFAARKVIVLRRMLGLSYGSVQLVLPNWRIEGADEPFAVRLFPGWNTYATYPCYAVSGISSVVVLFIAAVAFNKHPELLPPLFTSPIYLIVGFSAIWFILLSWGYRKALLDTHERRLLLFAQQVARLMRVRVVQNFEYVIYRANLASYELSRLGVKTKNLKAMLVHIEDKEFYSHRGTSLRGLARLALSAVGRYRRSGGSTVTQQLARTLFIVDQHKLRRRKLVELLLAIWFDGVFAKEKQLDIYLASVRFESKAYGLAAAMLHYFGEIKKDPTVAEAFFLIERVSNVRSRLLAAKINQTLNSAINAGLIDHDGAREVVSLYVAAVGDSKINDESGEGLRKLEAAWSEMS